MNAGLASERMLDDVRPILSDYGITVDVLEQGSADSGADLVLRLAVPGHSTEIYEIKVVWRLDTVAARVVGPGRRYRRLVVAPHVTPGAADILRHNDIDFVDLSGNLSLNLPGLRVLVTGKPALGSGHITGPRAPRAFRPAGLKVVFALLSWRDTVSLPVRVVADRSGVSVGSAQIVLQELQQSGYIYGESGNRVLGRGGELLDRWAESFTTVLAHKLVLGAFRDADSRWWESSRQLLSDKDVQIGGEAGGSVLDSDLVPVTTTLYSSGVPIDVLAARRWRKDSDRPNVEVRQRFWRVPDSSRILVPSPLIYADMWGSGDSRQRAHAERIRSVDDRLVELDRS